jgi:hypothetical protein
MHHRKVMTCLLAVAVLVFGILYQTLINVPFVHASTGLTVANSTSETQQSTTNTTFTASDTTIASGSLPAGTWLVIWGAATANSSTTSQTKVQLKSLWPPSKLA